MSSLKEIKDNKALIAYSLPGESSIMSYVASYKWDKLTNENLECCDFVLSPFDRSRSDCLWFNYDHKVKDISNIEFKLESCTLEGMSYKAYLSKGDDLLKRFKNSELSKMVLARTDFLGMDTSVLHYFEALSKIYVKDFISLVYVPDQLCWVGASPELLLGESNGVMNTVALAGTQEFNGSLDSIVWGEKEKQEHAFIEEFYDELFSALSLKYNKSISYTYPAAKMCHIRSDFNIVEVKDLAALIEAIHPGPALSGYPKDLAMKTIFELEGFNRKFYTGFLGPLSSSSSLRLFAHIRCMEIFENGVLLYVGGGYTKDSVINSEWEETVLKTSTMKRVLNTKM